MSIINLSMRIYSVPNKMQNIKYLFGHKFSNISNYHLFTTSLQYRVAIATSYRQMRLFATVLVVAPMYLVRNRTNTATRAYRKSCVHSESYACVEVADAHAEKRSGRPNCCFACLCTNVYVYTTSISVYHFSHSHFTL